MTPQARWRARFGNDRPCSLFATADLPRTFIGKLAPGETPAHWDILLNAPALDGLRFNLTKGWHLDDAVPVMREAKARKKRIMVDIVSRLRLRSADRSLIRAAPGSVLSVSARGTPTPETPLHFNRPLDCSLLGLGQPVILRDGRAQGVVTSVDARTETVGIRIDWTDEGILTLLEPPVNLPGFTGRVWDLTDRDAQILELAVREDVDLIAVSFLDDPACVARVAQALGSALKKRYPAETITGKQLPGIVAKIENARGVLSLPTIVDEGRTYAGVFAVEIARGDLALEVPLEELGPSQEYCAQCCASAAVPFGIATGLLGSMQFRPQPSRADILDAWYAVRSGASFVLLADETANDAQYPHEAIYALARLLARARRRGTSTAHGCSSPVKKEPTVLKQ